jgi:hypothetical protein
MFSTYLVGAYFAFVYGLSLVTFFFGASEFIQRAGAARCWAYGSIIAYISIDIGQLVFGTTATFMLWRWNREGRCLRSFIGFVIVAAVALTEMILRQECAQ